MPIIAGVAVEPPPVDPPPPVVLPEVGFSSAVFYPPAGAAIPLTDTEAGWFTLADGVSGLGAAPVEFTADPHPRGGARIRHIQPQPRDIVWPLYVYGEDHDEFKERWDQLAGILTSTHRLGPGILEIARPSGKRRRIRVHYREGWEGRAEQGYGIISDQAVVTFYCEDPYWYDPQEVTEYREHSGGGEDFLQPYPSVSSSQVLGSTMLNNPGNVIAWPVWTVTGPATTVTATHDDTGESWTLNPALVPGALAAHDQVIVTTDPPRVTKYTAEVQTIALGSASAGTVTVEFGTETTAALAYNASAATVQSALEALEGIAPGDVVVTGGPWPAVITLRFTGQYMGVDVGQVAVTPTGLTGGTVTVSTTTQGGTINWVGALNWPGARLWGLEPGSNAASLNVSGSAAGTSIEVAFNPRYETA